MQTQHPAAKARPARAEPALAPLRRQQLLALQRARCTVLLADAGTLNQRRRVSVAEPA